MISDNKIYPYVGRSTNPKMRFSSHKTHANNYNKAEDYNCGLSEFLYKNCGGWLEPSRIKFMIIDGIDDSRIPENVSKKGRLEWIFHELERIEEIWRTRLHTYPPYGLNKKGESNFKRWVLPKLNNSESVEKVEAVNKVATKNCYIKLKRLSPCELMNNNYYVGKNSKKKVSETKVNISRSEINPNTPNNTRVRRSARTKYKSIRLKDEIWIT